MTTHNPKAQSDLEQKLDQLNQFKIDLGLDRLQQVLDRLHLSASMPTIITVGGTNGKGSTVAALAALLKVKNKSFGAFTSPHIHRFNERINVNGQLAADAEILAAFERVDVAKGEVNLSYFESALLGALLIFIQHDVDFMLLEVGLGGRLDATNVLDADAAIITTVDLDHTEWLGNDIETIAKEKAGIMRAGKPIIYGDHDTPQAITDKAAELGAHLWVLGANFEASSDGESWQYRHADWLHKSLKMPALKGAWQIRNFSSALSALLALKVELSTHEIQMAIADWQLPGRLQTIQNKPLVLVDVAHNRQAAQALQQWLSEHPIAGRTLAVFSVLADKNLATWLGGLDGVIDHWLVFELANSRAMQLNELKLALADHVGMFSQFESGQTAYQAALSTAAEVDRIIVFGSFHVLDEVLK